MLAAGAAAPPLVHPAAVISPSVRLAVGVVVSAGAIVQQDARIGRFCVGGAACSVDHDNLVGDHVSFGPGAHTAGGRRSGLHRPRRLNRLTIGPRATIGPGAVVTRDVPEGATVVGNPARVLEKR